MKVIIREAAYAEGKLEFLRRQIKLGQEARQYGNFAEIDDAELETYLDSLDQIGGRPA